jgi:hypothetical protein
MSKELSIKERLLDALDAVDSTVQDEHSLKLSALRIEVLRDLYREELSTNFELDAEATNDPI